MCSGLIVLGSGAWREREREVKERKRKKEKGIETRRGGTMKVRQKGEEEGKRA